MIKRLEKEIKDLTENPPANIVVVPLAEKTSWEATLTGPAETAYQGGKFKLSVKIPETYPFKAPEINFITPIFHPNVTEKGEICQEMLGAKDWQPTQMTRSLIEKVLNMLAIPNMEQASNPQAMELYKNDRAKFEERVKAEVQKYAK